MNSHTILGIDVTLFLTKSGLTLQFSIGERCSEKTRSESYLYSIIEYNNQNVKILETEPHLYVEDK